MQRTLVLYESKYGSTKAVARCLALVLGPSRLCRVNDFKAGYRAFDQFVIGTPIYKGIVSPRVWNFVRVNRDWLRDKTVAIFCTCLNPEDGRRNLAQIEVQLGQGVPLTRVFGGRLCLDELDEEDYQSIEVFSRRTGFPFEDADDLDMAAVVDYALEIKDDRDGRQESMAYGDLKALVEAYLTTHSTCTLATGYKGRVRATPLEYAYRDGHMYILSEGGEKFGNLLLNDEVSVAVYDDYESMAKLAGMQLSGRAELVEDSADYEDILRMRGLDPVKIGSLLISLNVIKVRLMKAEFLNAQFKAKGYEISQVFEF